MKTLGTILMVIVILAGLVLAITPFVADRFFPLPENVVRQAKPEAAARALRQWFDAANADLVDVQAIQRQGSAPSTAGNRQADTTAWFSFSVSRKPVESYILAKKLQQNDLSESIFEQQFDANSPPASWWQPRALKQQSYFSGIDQGKSIALIYNPDSKRAVLVIRSISE